MSIATPEQGTLDFRNAKRRYWTLGRIISIVLDEFAQAVAAERRYDELKCRSAAAFAGEGVARDDLPRRIFDEFYS